MRWQFGFPAVGVERDGDRVTARPQRGRLPGAGHPLPGAGAGHRRGRRQRHRGQPRRHPDRAGGRAAGRRVRGPAGLSRQAASSATTRWPPPGSGSTPSCGRSTPRASRSWPTSAASAACSPPTTRPPRAPARGSPWPPRPGWPPCSPPLPPADPEAAVLHVEQTADHCIKCNICNTVCPVSAVTDLFPGPKYEGPQGQRFRAGIDTGESPDKSLDYCSACGLCTQACPEGVMVAEINQVARSRLVADRGGLNLRDQVISRPSLMGGHGQAGGADRQRRHGRPAGPGAGREDHRRPPGRGHAQVLGHDLPLLGPLPPRPGRAPPAPSPTSTAAPSRSSSRRSARPSSGSWSATAPG